MAVLGSSCAHRSCLLDYWLHTREDVSCNLPLPLDLLADENFLIVMSLNRSLLQPVLSALCSGPGECPLIVHDNNFVDGEVYLQLDGSEDSFV